MQSVCGNLPEGQEKRAGHFLLPAPGTHLFAILAILRTRSSLSANIISLTLPPARTRRRCAVFSESSFRSYCRVQYEGVPAGASSSEPEEVDELSSDGSSTMGVAGGATAVGGPIPNRRLRTNRSPDATDGLSTEVAATAFPVERGVRPFLLLLLLPRPTSILAASAGDVPILCSCRARFCHCRQREGGIKRWISLAQADIPI